MALVRAAAGFVIGCTCTPFDARTDMAFGIALIQSFGFAADICTNRLTRGTFTFFGVAVARETELALQDIVEIPCAIFFTRHYAAFVRGTFDIFRGAFGLLARSPFVVAAIGAEIEGFLGSGAFGSAMIHGSGLGISTKTEIGVGGTVCWYRQQTFFAQLIANRFIRRTLFGFTPRFIVETGFKVVIVGTLEITDNADFRETFFFRVTAHELIHRAKFVRLPAAIKTADVIRGCIGAFKIIWGAFVSDLDAFNRPTVTDGFVGGTWNRRSPLVVFTTTFNAFVIVGTCELTCITFERCVHAIGNSARTLGFVIRAGCGMPLMIISAYLEIFFVCAFFIAGITFISCRHAASQIRIAVWFVTGTRFNFPVVIIATNGLMRRIIAFCIAGSACVVIGFTKPGIVVANRFIGRAGLEVIPLTFIVAGERRFQIFGAPRIANITIGDIDIHNPRRTVAAAGGQRDTTRDAQTIQCL